MGQVSHTALPVDFIPLIGHITQASAVTHKQGVETGTSFVCTEKNQRGFPGQELAALVGITCLKHIPLVQAPS